MKKYTYDIILLLNYGSLFYIHVYCVFIIKYITTICFCYYCEN